MRRKNCSSRFLFATAAFGILIVAIHFYLHIYKGPRRSFDITLKPANQQQQEQMMDLNPFQPSSSSMDIENNQKRIKISHNHHDPRQSLQYKIVHLDLKGMPPTVTAYESIFPFFKKLGVTGVLIEYEDMFPYQGMLEPISNKESYSEKDIKRILELAKTNDLEVIPLIQTFGHLEFVLKLKEFKKLREVEKYMQVICPTNNDSQVVIKEMISQVMRLHPNIKYFHIGSDEVYHIGQCPLCRNRMKKYGIDESQLFLQHATLVAKIVKDMNVKPLMWDDEFRKLDESAIEASGLGNLVEIIVWNYHSDVENRLSFEMWAKYAKIFKSVWIGSAFKGANKPNSVVVNESMYLSNHYSWQKTMTNVQNIVNFKGIVLTGWQRYDHFSVLCELLPSAIPSLTACMKFLDARDIPPMEIIILEASSTLKCGGYVQFCEFPGAGIHQEIIQLEYLKAGLKRIEEQHVFLGWAQEINLDSGFSGPSLIEPIFQEIDSLKTELDKCQTSLQKAMKQFFPSWSVTEWMVSYFRPFYNKVNNLHNRLNGILEKDTFPRRPIDYQVSGGADDQI